MVSSGLFKNLPAPLWADQSEGKTEFWLVPAHHRRSAYILLSAAAGWSTWVQQTNALVFFIFSIYNGVAFSWLICASTTRCKRDSCPGRPEQKDQQRPTHRESVVWRREKLAKSLTTWTTFMRKPFVFFVWWAQMDWWTNDVWMNSWTSHATSKVP